jgi:uncharacterized protein (DUF58 family)
MIPKSLFKKIKALEIRTRNIVDAVVSGQYKSAFKGRGINFADVRPYQLGDDFRFIDWKVMARTGGEPYIKIFEEERELTVILMVDVSGSGEFGSSEQSKLDTAAEIAAVLGFSAIKSQDKVGLMLFTDKVEYYLPPKRGKSHVLRLVREIFVHKRQSKKTSLADAFKFLMRTQKKRAIVFVVSDFIDVNFETEFQMAAKKHDIVPVVIQDKHEKELPDAGILALEDAESGEIYYINSSSGPVKEAYKQMALAKELDLDRFFRASGVLSIKVSPNEAYLDSLVHFFKRRLNR